MQRSHKENRMIIIKTNTNPDNNKEKLPEKLGLRRL